MKCGVICIRCLSRHIHTTWEIYRTFVRVIKELKYPFGKVDLSFFSLWPLEMSSVIDSLKQQLQEIPESNNNMLLYTNKCLNKTKKVNSAEVLNSVLCLKELSGQTQLEGKWIQLTNVCKILGDAARTGKNIMSISNCCPNKQMPL